MKKWIFAIWALTLSPTFACAETWGITFKDKNQTSITGGASGTDAPAVDSVTLETEAEGAGFMTTGTVAGDSTIFSPNTNVQLESHATQNTGWWKGVLKMTPTISAKVSSISVVIRSFNSKGEEQSGSQSRTLNLTVTLNGSSQTLQNVSTTGEKDATYTFTFSAPVSIVKRQSFSLSVKAERANEKLGCYFAMKSIGVTYGSVTTYEDATVPRGYVVKSLPAGKTFYFTANVQKPIITAGEGTFTVTETGICLTELEGTDFAQVLEDPKKAYLLEVDFTDGTAVAMLNPTTWRDGVEDCTISGNILTFADDSLARLIAALDGGTGTLSYRIREAWTLDEIFGASYEAGELKRGTALTGDAIFLYAVDGKSTIKFYNHATKGWCAVGVSSTTAAPENAPVHPHKPLRIVRKKGADVELNLLGEAMTGDALVAVYKGVDVISSGDAFEQTLAGSGISDVLSLTALEVGGERYVYDAENGKWRLENDASDADTVSVEDGFEIQRNDTSPTHVRVRVAQ